MIETKGNRITYFGHSTFSLTTPSGQVALIDPWAVSYTHLTLPTICSV